MSLPARALPGPLLSIETSACVLTVVMNVEVLFAPLVSVLDVFAVAVLLSTVPLAVEASGCTVMVNCAVARLGSKKIEQVTVAPPEQVAAGPVFWTTPRRTRQPEGDPRTKRPSPYPDLRWIALRT